MSIGARRRDGVGSAAAVGLSLVVALGCGTSGSAPAPADSGATQHEGGTRDGGPGAVACAPVDGVALRASDTLLASGAPWSATDKFGPGPVVQSVFYVGPTPLPGAAPGTLIRSEPIDGVDPTGAVKVTRILYHSTALDCRDIAVSGAVLVPAGSPPPGGWPVLSWAHGTSGIGDACAPSKWKDFFEYGDYMLRLASAGFVVAATDYEGLGTPGAHPYLDKEVEARGVIDAVRAARAVVKGTSSRWIAIGHSQGGQAALAASEDAATRAPELEFLGAVAIAPAPSIRLVPLVATDPANAGYVAFLAGGVLAVNRSLTLPDLLGPQGAALAGLMDTGCWYEVLSSYGRVTPDQFDPPTAAGKAARDAFFARNEIGDRPLGKPALLVQGGADGSVPPAITQRLHDTYCAAGETIRLDMYPGMSHDGVLPPSFDSTVAWIRARLRGEPAPTDCGDAGIR